MKTAASRGDKGIVQLYIFSGNGKAASFPAGSLKPMPFRFSPFVMQQ
jgi:hypothetical protein